MNPWFWEHDKYSEAEARTLLRGAPALVGYWLHIFVSFAITGTHIMVPYRPANKREILLFEQIARAMEIFAIAHEYGHHHHGHGRQLQDDPKREELDADQFALRIGYEVEHKPLILPNPYMSSGAGGVVLLLALETLGKFRKVINDEGSDSSLTHPTASERIARFDSIAVLRPMEFAALKAFRNVSSRIMAAVDAELADLLRSIPADSLNHLRALTHA